MCVTLFWTVLSSILVLSLTDVDNVARGPDQPCSPDCFTHAMVDNRRIFPKSVLEADTIIVSCGLAIFLVYFLVDASLARAAHYDKFLESFEDNCPGVCDSRSVWMIVCRRLDDPDCDEKPGTHVSRNPRIMRSIMESKDYHELHSRLYDGMSRFLSGKNVVTMIC